MRGPRNDSANYRPISILSVLHKIFEKATLSRLIPYLNSKHLLHDFLFVFQMKPSTEQARMKLLNFLHSALDSGSIPADIFRNIRKTFDSLTHENFLVEYAPFW